MASSFFAAPCIAFSTSPSCLIDAALLAIALARPCDTDAELRALFGPSSHWMTSASRAVFARHQLSATTATPSVMRTTFFTPGIPFAFESSTLTTLPPMTGHCASDA